MTAFPKINTTVSKIFSDINRHAHNRNIGFKSTILMPNFSYSMDKICVNICGYDI